MFAEGCTILENRCGTAPGCLVEKDGKYSINKKWVGKDASLFLKELGITSDARLIICETDENHPFVQVEMMMPVLPIVRVKNIEEAMDFASKVGALTVLKEGAQSSLPTLKDVENFRG